MTGLDPVAYPPVAGSPPTQGAARAPGRCAAASRPSAGLCSGLRRPVQGRGREPGSIADAMTPRGEGNVFPSMCSAEATFRNHPRTTLVPQHRRRGLRRGGARETVSRRRPQRAGPPSRAWGPDTGLPPSGGSRRWVPRLNLAQVAPRPPAMFRHVPLVLLSPLAALVGRLTADDQDSETWRYGNRYSSCSAGWANARGSREARGRHCS